MKQPRSAMARLIGETQARRSSGPRPMATLQTTITRLRTKRICQTVRPRVSHLIAASWKEKRK